MIRNDVFDNFIKSVYEVISKKVCLKCFISPDKSRVMKVWNIKHGGSEMRHFIYSKEDISLSNFLFRVDVYVNYEDIEEFGYYAKWISLTEIINEGWIEISSDYFNEFREKIEEKYNELERVSKSI